MPLHDVATSTAAATTTATATGDIHLRSSTPLDVHHARVGGIARDTRSSTGARAARLHRRRTERASVPLPPPASIKVCRAARPRDWGHGAHHPHRGAHARGTQSAPMRSPTRGPLGQLRRLEHLDRGCITTPYGFVKRGATPPRRWGTGKAEIGWMCGWGGVCRQVEGGVHVPTKCAEPKGSKQSKVVTPVTHSRRLDAVNRVARCKVVEGVRVCVGHGTHLSFKWRSAPASMRMPHTTECPSHAETCKGVLQERTRRHSDGDQALHLQQSTDCCRSGYMGGGRGGEGRACTYRLS
jgi:hypothetical protein